MVKTIKISDEHYQELVKMAGTLQSEAGKPVPINEAVGVLLKNKVLWESAMTIITAERPENLETKQEIKERWKHWGSRIFLKKEKQKGEKSKAEQKPAENI